MEYNYVKFEVLIPGEYVEKLRDTVNAAGACRLGNYDNCISYYPVNGYWRPLTGAEPYLGKIGEISNGEEMKVEFLCNKEFIPAVVKAIRKAHPYEEPMFYIVPLANEF